MGNQSLSQPCQCGKTAAAAHGSVSLPAGRHRRQLEHVSGSGRYETVYCMSSDDAWAVDSLVDVAALIFLVFVLA